ncbi:YihA family ribosome biogenesis GTP-binding protein, partial [Klebsiella quasipneumoniae]
PFSSLKKSGVDKLRQKLDSWFNEIPPQEEERAADE